MLISLRPYDELRDYGLIRIRIRVRVRGLEYEDEDKDKRVKDTQGGNSNK
jgi:hypothetical protein